MNDDQLYALAWILTIAATLALFVVAGGGDQPMTEALITFRWDLIRLPVIRLRRWWRSNISQPV